jgi:hypothetical protein
MILTIELKGVETRQVSLAFNDFECFETRNRSVAVPDTSNFSSSLSWTPPLAGSSGPLARRGYQHRPNTHTVVPCSRPCPAQCLARLPMFSCQVPGNHLQGLGYSVLTASSRREGLLLMNLFLLSHCSIRSLSENGWHGPTTSFPFSVLSTYPPHCFGDAGRPSPPHC